MPDYNTKQYITEFHPDIVKAVPVLPSAASYSGIRVFYQDQYWCSNGTYWLSERKEISLIPRVAQPFPAGTVDFDVQIPNYNLGGWKLEGIFISMVPNTAQSGTVFYNVAAYSNTDRKSVV